MKDFITNLYANEKFPIYLGIVILVLVIAFLVVFFLGKKDKKKLEQTRKLEKIENDAFSQVTSPVNIEVNANPIKEVNTLNQAPTDNYVSTPINNMAPEPTQPAALSVVEPAPSVQPIASPVVEPTPSAVQQPVVSPTPIVQSAPTVPVIETPQLVQSPQPVIQTPVIPEIQEPIAQPNIARFDELASSIENELNTLEKEQAVAQPLLNENTTPEINIPNVQNNTPIIDIATPATQTTTQVNEVFSSVYPPKSVESLVPDETMEIELPKLK